MLCLSHTHALHGQSRRHTHTLSLPLVHAHTRSHSSVRALDAKGLYLICGHAGAAINMRETPGTSVRVGMFGMETRRPLPVF